jgi:hypothetical protein
MDRGGAPRGAGREAAGGPGAVLHAVRGEAAGAQGRGCGWLPAPRTAHPQGRRADLASGGPDGPRSHGKVRYR